MAARAPRAKATPARDRLEALGGGFARLLREPARHMHPVLRVLLERAGRGRAQDRADGHTLCLAIEGGGMRGAVTAGMCVVLEAAGLTRCFDRIYGVSAGALNAWGTATGQAALVATHYQDAVAASVVSGIGPLRGRPVIDFDLLFDELIAVRKPLSFERLARGPELRALATSLETMSLRVLGGFADAEEVRTAVRASSFLPRLAGEAPVFRGERLADGSLIEPIPVHTALDEGATHVLVLRSRSAGARKTLLSELGEALAWRDDPGLRELLRVRQGRYNRQAAELRRGVRRAGAHVHQITVPDSARLGRSLYATAGRIAEAVRVGADAMAAAVLSVPVEVCWQPVVYAPAEPRAPGAERPAGGDAISI